VPEKVLLLVRLTVGRGSDWAVALPMSSSLVKGVSWGGVFGLRDTRIYLPRLYLTIAHVSLRNTRNKDTLTHSE
jgi:hypothetical protein